MLELDGVELEFDEDALVAIAKEAIERKTGARGLRSIIESTMLDVMYELPSREDVKNVSLQQKQLRIKRNRNCFLKMALYSMKVATQKLQHNEQT